MKKLPIQSENYRHLLQGFAGWLDLLGYSAGTIKTLPIHVREFLYHLESVQNKQHISQVEQKDLVQFMDYIQLRNNQIQGGGLSSSYINTILLGVNTFSRYLNQTAKRLLEPYGNYLPIDIPKRVILTEKEIQQLYDCTYYEHRENSVAMGQRDRAILSLYYGCGLRRSEGLHLNITDIDLQNRRLFVRKGKGNKQRYVPIADKIIPDLKSYLEEGRNWFLEDHSDSRYLHRHTQAPEKESHDKLAFLLNQKGQRLQSLDSRFRFFKESSGINKPFTPHSLRHSIATHLLAHDMPIEEIARFLGHSSLVSTQLYTALLDEGKSKSQPYSNAHPRIKIQLSEDELKSHTS